MTLHELKLESTYYDAVVMGYKTFEIRRYNKDYKVGDVLKLREVDPPTEYTGRFCFATIQYILTHEKFPYGIQEGFVAMSIEVFEITELRYRGVIPVE